MRYLPLLFLCLFFSERLPAQSTDWFAPMGATWTIVEHSSVPPANHPYGSPYRPYFQAVVDKDSMIQGLPCRRIIKMRHDGTTVPESEVWLYTDSNRVYTYQHDTFLLFFDRSLNIGDTFRAYAPPSALYYDVLCSYWFQPDSISNELVIDTILIDTIDGYPLKRWKIGYAGSPKSDGWNIWSFSETIGSGAPLFGYTQVFCLGGFGGGFHCYEDSNISINIDTVPCTYIIYGIGTEIENHPVTISPNPTTGSVTISLGQDIEMPKSIAVLYDLQGRAVRQFRITAWPASLHLDVVPGIYLLHLPTGQGGRGFPVVVE